jgi:hypothetical protein
MEFVSGIGNDLEIPQYPMLARVYPWCVHLKKKEAQFILEV